MNIYKVSLTVTMTVVILSVGATGQVRTNGLDFSDYKPKSPEKANKYSALGMLIPVFAGITWWAVDAPKTKTETHYYNGWSHTSTHVDEPNRAIPAMLIVSGVVLGPSAGYFYGACPERGATGILIRVGTGAVTVIAASAAAEAYESDEFMDFSGLVAAATVGAIGSGVILVEAIIDIAKVKSAVEKNNMKKAQQRGANVTLLPRYFADSGAAGLELNITF